jgi:hypothetical protein
MTNFEDGNLASIEYGMNHSHCKNAIANIIDIAERCHILTIFWSIVYDVLKPLKLAGEDQIPYQH